MNYNTKDIRNIAIIGHGSSGKTSLNEAILFSGDKISLMGSVDAGKTVSDYNEQEIAKKMSIRSSISYVEWNNSLINIIDTPGAPDFSGEVITAISAADSAIFVINGEEGVEIETIKNWRKCNLPKFIFINKMYKDNANFKKCIDALKDNFKDTSFVPLTIPIGEGKNFKGVIDLINKEARYFDEDGKKINKEKAPEDMKEIDEYFTQILEAAVETDEELMTKYFDGKEISYDEIVKGLKTQILEGSFVPVLCGDSLKNSGVPFLLDNIVNYLPSPSDKGNLKGKDLNDKEIEIQIDSSKPVSVFIFKTSIDQFTGKLSYMKVISGQIKNDMELYNPYKSSKIKCGKLFKLMGKNLKDVNMLNAGDIGVLVKLETVATNETLCDPNNIVKINQIEFPQPIFSQAIKAVNKKDEEKLISILQKSSEEDPTFTIKFNSETRQNVISGMGDRQIRLILEKINERNKIETQLEEIKIAYRETISKKSNAEYTHKKQSGGHGQYGKVFIEIWPIEEGKNYEFVNAIVGGVISKGYIPGCEKGFHEAMEDGVLARYKVVDVGIKLYDGKEHPVDSSEMSFKIASRMAFKEAMKNAGPVLLEPIMELNVYTDHKFVGDILSDISSKRGRVLGQDSLGGGIELIKALVPQNELLRYSIDLKSITSGTGSFELNFHKYQHLTGKIADDIIKKRKSETEE